MSERSLRGKPATRRETAARLLTMGFRIWRLRSEWPEEVEAKGEGEEEEERAQSKREIAVQREASREGERTLFEAQKASWEEEERAAQIALLGWEELEQAIRECSACPLCQGRRQAVPGVGDRKGRWLFVGEGPGEEEDRQGEPFVGPAGKLLDEMLFALGLRRGTDVYIANAVKCRPPQNRTPRNEEVAACNPFLRRQIALLSPRVIVVLGRPAALAVLNEEVRIASARGRCFFYGSIPVVVTYHPAYLLRNPADKRKAWRDLLFARRVLAENASER